MKDGFQTPTGVFEPDIWIPMATAQRIGVLDATSGLDASVGMIATPKPGTPADAITEDVRRILADHLAVPATDIHVTYGRILDGHPETRALQPIAAVALAAVGVVLLIACFNVAGLLLAQSAERQREMGMRAALGASRSRLIRQLLTDGLVLAALAGTASVMLASWSAALLSTFSLPAPIPQRLHFVADWRLIAFAIALSLVAALLPALVPALQVWRADLTQWIRADTAGGSGTRRQTRARRAFLVLQVAGSTVFVIASAIFAERFVRAKSTDAGFDTIHTAVMEIDPPHYGYSVLRSRELIDALTARLAAMPGIVSASASDRIPFSVGFPNRTKVSVSGRDCRSSDCPSSMVYNADGAHASAMGLSMRAGRWFDPATAADRDAVVINQAAADAIWPDTYPVGQTFRDDSGSLRRVVGVTNDVAVNLLNAQSRPQPAMYWPLEDTNYGRSITVVVRTSGAPDGVVEPMRRALHDLAPDVPPQSIGTMQQRLALPLWPTRTLAGFFGACGLLALLLATVGLFGVTHYVVSQRTRDFGVRLAIGASAGALHRMVLSESVRLIAPGVLIGLIAGAGLSRLIRSQLIGLERVDARIFAAAMLIEVSVALAAAWMPARKAATTNPLSALRAE
jgi:predicted permease